MFRVWDLALIPGIVVLCAAVMFGHMSLPGNRGDTHVGFEHWGPGFEVECFGCSL